MIVVTGTAPRCGTSAMMRLLLTEFKPHSMMEKFPSYTAKEMNPLGFWDIKKEELESDNPIPYEEGSVAKLWGAHFQRVDFDQVNLCIVMKRNNIEDQIKSTKKCAIAEGLGELNDEAIQYMFARQYQDVQEHFPKDKTIIVDMDHLRHYPDELLSYIKEITLCQ